MKQTLSVRLGTFWLNAVGGFKRCSEPSLLGWEPSSLGWVLYIYVLANAVKNVVNTLLGWITAAKLVAQLVCPSLIAIKQSNKTGHLVQKHLAIHPQQPHP